jgi:hypothetical protein
MKKIITCLLMCILMTACKPQYTLTKDSILARAYDPGIEMVKSEGAEGPFKDALGISGYPDQGVGWTSSDGKTKIDVKAEPGYRLQLQVYENSKQEYFWTILKIQNQK